MATIYALLVGINNYPIKPLQGCINDVNAVKDFLLDMYGKSAQVKLSIKTLTDDDPDKPTRQNLINAFDFFNDAVNDDVCIFYYSGHGSYSYALPDVESDTGFVQSFVCQDSRLPGGMDFVDKEMSYLVWKTFVNKPAVDFIAITDCCHSGTIMKEFYNAEIVERMMPGEADHVPLKIEDYLGYGTEVDGVQAYEETISGNKKTVKVKQGRSIHLAASRDSQTSKELDIDGVRRGAFTHSLLKVLYQNNGQVSYKDLVDQAAALVKNLVTDQQPDVNINGFSSEQAALQKNKLFLSQKTNLTDPTYLVYHDPKYKWCIKAGLVHGVSKGDQVIIDGVCTTIITASPLPDLSMIMANIALGKTDKTYFATVVRHPNQAIKVSFDADISPAIKELIQNNFANNTNPFVELVLNTTGQLIIHSNDLNEAFITKPGSDKILFEPIKIFDETNVQFFLERIEIISRWQHLLEFNNSTLKTNGQYSLQLFKNTIAGNYDPDTFEPVEKIESVNDLFYKTEAGQWYQPAFRLAITNNSSANSLWVTNAYLGFDYSIDVSTFLPMEIGPKITAWLKLTVNEFDEDVVKMKIDTIFQDLGYNEITEYIKLFISTEKIDTYKLKQGGVDLPALRDMAMKDIGLIERGAGAETNGNTPPAQFWKTETLGFRIVKPQSEKELKGNTPLNIGAITITTPVGVTGKVSLSSSAHTSKSADGVAPPHTAFNNSYLEPFDLLPGTREGITMDVLELVDIKNKELLSYDNAMVIKLSAARSLKEESVLPVGYDKATGLYYPLGFMNEAGDIEIYQLPEETETDHAISQRSFFGSIKIYFQKVIGQALGYEYKYPQLAIVEVNNNLEVKYNKDETEVAAKVKTANNILIFVHGIIGDTEGMVKCIKTPMDADGNTLASKTDLILAFDYENLNTKIEVTALDLKNKLKAVGITEGSGKKVTIISHSMGGMVSRWFIEHLGGNKIVTNLFMLGTPNNGTPWADVRDLVEVLITYAINGAVFLKPWTFLLSLLGKAVKGLQETIKQMDSKTGMYDTLNSGIDPAFPYVIIAGNTRAITVKYEETASLISHLFTNVKKKGVYTAFDLALFREPNDIAVSDKSISKIKDSENWEIVPVIHQVASDHLNYFVNKDAVLIIYNYLNMYS